MDIEIGTTFRLFQPARPSMSPAYFLCAFVNEGVTRTAIAQNEGDALGPLVLTVEDDEGPNSAGDWQLTVYEQTSSTNTDPTLAARQVWSELVRANIA